MYDGPVREGNRGGAGDFRWANVVNDKYRESYLGSTVNAPQGRWQKNKDIHWYARDKTEDDAEAAAAARREEIRRLKEAEEEALSIALGHAPKKKEAGDGEGTGANDVPVAGKREKDAELERLEKEERRREKELRKEQRALKRAEREVRREERDRVRDDRHSRPYRDDRPDRYGRPGGDNSRRRRHGSEERESVRSRHEDDRDRGGSRRREYDDRSHRRDDRPYRSRDRSERGSERDERDTRDAHGGGRREGNGNRYDRELEGHPTGERDRRRSRSRTPVKRERNAASPHVKRESVSPAVARRRRSSTTTPPASRREPTGSGGRGEAVEGGLRIKDEDEF